MLYKLGKRSKNKSIVDQIITDGINYAYWDLEPQERALAITHMKTNDPKAIIELSQAIEDGLPEFFIRMKFIEMVLTFRLDAELGINAKEFGEE